MNEEERYALVGNIAKAIYERPDAQGRIYPNSWHTDKHPTKRTRVIADAKAALAEVEKYYTLKEKC